MLSANHGDELSQESICADPQVLNCMGIPFLKAVQTDVHGVNLTVQCCLLQFQLLQSLTVQRCSCLQAPNTILPLTGDLQKVAGQQPCSGMAYLTCCCAVACAS